MIEPKRFPRVLSAFGSTPHDWLNTGLMAYILFLCLPHLGIN